MPSDIAEMLNTQIGAKKSWNGQYVVDCSTVPGLPDLSFHFNGKPYALKGSDYVLEVQGTCISSFTPMDIIMPGGGQLWIVGMSLLNMYHKLTVVNWMAIGDVFLRRYYTVFDYERHAVGFAKSVTFA
jgi:saccharopepsin